MKRTFAFFMLACILLASCNSTHPIAHPEQVTVQYTSASIPWLTSLYTCAGEIVVIAEQRSADYLDLQFAGMVIRIGRPNTSTSFVYQIGTEALLVIVNEKNPVQVLTEGQVFELFTGQVQNWKSINGTDAPIQVWAFPTGEDVQEIFSQTVLHGSPITSGAHLANSQDEMVQAVQKDVNAIGIITQKWKTGNISGAYTIATNLPVLAETLSKPEKTIAHIIACMQK
jgi:hypothetical protein